LPRSPLVSEATKELSANFGILTDADFVDNTWAARLVAQKPANSKATAVPNANISGEAALAKLNAYGDVIRELTTPPDGVTQADQITELINGSISIGEFHSSDSIDANYSEQFKIYGCGKSDVNKLFVDSTFTDISGRDSLEKLSINSTLAKPARDKTPNAYIMNVHNPMMGPSTRDVGPLEVFMNCMPTLELSKCVPYVNVELITSSPGRDAAGNFAAPTLLRFLNPSAPSEVDIAMLDAQATEVASEATSLGTGTRSSMELFTTPQTLVNLGPTGEEYVPVIDRLRPLASLGDLSISVKMQKSTTMFTQIRMEVNVHDRSRLREVADLVRPDLYSRTFIDITYGWSHPEGGMLSNNSFGKFLDAMKVTGRYRIASSTYSFEPGGGIKIALSLFSLGSIDLLSLASRETRNTIRQLDELAKSIRRALEAKRAVGTAGPGMAKFDFMNSITDGSSLLRAAGDPEFFKKLDSIQGDGANIELKDELLTLIINAIGEVTLKNGDWTIIPKPSPTVTSSGINIEDYGQATAGLGRIADEYNEIIAKIPKMGADKISDEFFEGDYPKRLAAMFSTTPSGDVVEKFKAEYCSLGAVMAALVLHPLAASQLYDEIQLVFYPFNDYAGGVHGCPISWFPIEHAKLKTYVGELAKETPEISLNAMIELINGRFVNFAPNRAYLMAEYYNPTAAEEGRVEYTTGKVTVNGKQVTAAAGFTQTHEERLEKVGIHEKQFTQPVLGIFTEGCPLLDSKGEKVPADGGRSKTLLKIHVFDAAAGAYRTLGELLKATRDDQLGVIRGAVATALTAGGDAAARRQALAPILEAGEAAGILRKITTHPDYNGPAEYSVDGSYDSIKRLVSAGMPTITYGSSTSAITNASFSTANSAAMANAMMARAYQEPAGEASPSQVNGGVPMQIIPAALSLSTFGCPLFTPMQQLFVDFGTGTSIDNVYYVLGAEHKIGKSGFTTDVKLGYGEGFATHVSLSQNLTTLANRVNDALRSDPPAAFAAAVVPAAAAGSSTTEAQAIAEARRKYDALLEEVGRAIGRALAPPARVAIEVKMKIEAELRRVQALVLMEIEEKKKEAIDKALALIPPEVRIKAEEATKLAAAAAAKAAEVQADVAYALTIVDLVLNADKLIAELGAEAAAIIVKTAQEELAKQLAAEPPEPPEAEA